MMDSAEIARLRALLDGAIPGPWIAVYDDSSGEVSIRQVEAPSPGVYVEVASTSQWPDDEDTSATAEFIAAARTAVPSLLGALEGGGRSEATDATPPPAALRDILAELLAQGFDFDSSRMGYVDTGSVRRARLDGTFDLRNVADAILSDPRIAVVQLPEVEPESFEEGPTHAKLPHAEDKWPRVQRRRDGDNRIALASINNPFRTDIEAADTAAAILAILRHTNNRGDQS